MRNVKLVVGYDGTQYRGFQRQTKWSNTIENVLEECLTKIFDKHIRINAAGRTDAGVHATGQVCNFLCPGSVPTERLPHIMNNVLPVDIRVLEAKTVDSSFHARKSAKSREYRYCFYRGKALFPGIDRYSVKLDNRFDLKKAQDMCCILKGSWDCRSFMSSGSSARSTVKTITKCNIEKLLQAQGCSGLTELDQYLFTIEADSFLYNMVRILAGCIVRVATGELTAQEFEIIRNAKDRRLAGKMLPPNGLYLTKITY